MKRILNKMICFMWGHEYEIIVTASYQIIWFGGQSIEDYTIKVCKHCGAHKHDN